MKRLLLIVPLLVLSLFYDTDDAFACSGIGTVTLWEPYINYIPDYETIVRGTIIEVSGGNAIIDVDTYLVGSGDNQLFAFWGSPGYHISRFERQYTFGCGTEQSPMLDDTELRVVMGLSRNMNGTYNIQFVTYITPTEMGDTVSYLNYDGDIDDGDSFDYDNMQYITSPVAEFEAIIAEITGQTPSLPVYRNQHQSPLRRREVHIVTENGTHYMLPIDGGAVVEIDPLCSENCPIFSPDYSHILYPISLENTYVLTYRASSDLQRESASDTFNVQHPPDQVVFEDVLFSPNSASLLTWFEDRLSISHISGAWQQDHNYPQLHELIEFQLAVDDPHPTSLHGSAAWSGNSRIIVYWDADGLHRFDLMTMDSTLIVEGVNQPEHLEVSQSGRYVLYGDTREWMLLDTMTDTAWENAVINPDESHIYHFTLNSDPQETNLPDANQPRFHVQLHTSADQVVSWYWWGRDLLIMEFLQGDAPCDGSYLVSDFGVNRRIFLEQCGQLGDLVIVDELYEGILISTGHRLSDTGFPIPTSVTNPLDSPIASISWGEPLWYVEE